MSLCECVLMQIILQWVYSGTYKMQMGLKLQQPAYKCEKMQMRALFVNGPIPAQCCLWVWVRRIEWNIVLPLSIRRDWSTKTFRATIPGADITTHDSPQIASCPSKIRQITPIGVFMGAEFKNGLYCVLKPLLHCILAWILYTVSTIRQIVSG